MLISKKLGLDFSQYEVDFVIVDIDNDVPLFIDPFLISNQRSPWCEEADLIIKNFFNEFKNCILSNSIDDAYSLFSFMSEPKETCLGLGKNSTTNGKGVGDINAKRIVDKIEKSNAINKGIVKNLEDLMIFIEDISKDKISDMSTNILRGHLIEYTRKQCKLHGISMNVGETLPYWCKVDRKWVYSEEELLIIDGRQIILVPKNIVSPMKEYSTYAYNWFFVVETVRNFHLTRRSSLVKAKKLKSGRTKYSLSKKNTQKHIKEEVSRNFRSYKEYLRSYTLKHPEIFERFIDDKKKKVKPLKNEDFENEKVSFEDVIDKIIHNLLDIPTGRENANEYHHYVKMILEVIFYPMLNQPVIEKEIHEGRKRIDIVMNNNSEKGFFTNLMHKTKIFSPYVFIECKNYGKDINNPELDQLSGRFSDRRGEFGFLLCRDIKNSERLLKKCQDTYKDGRGLIIVLTDYDIMQLLNFRKKEVHKKIDEYLEMKKRDIIVC